MPVSYVRPMPTGGSKHHWNSDKKTRSLSLTHEAWELISEQARKLDGNRSEVIEIVMRYADQARLDLQVIRQEILGNEEDGSEQCPMPTPTPKAEGCAITPACPV